MNIKFDTRYKFTAKELDNETSYTYFEARYYDSDLSNWLSVDPMSYNALGWSPYRYGFNNPLSYTDPTGMLENIDWFQNTETGEVMYVSWLGKDDASTLGNGWEWLGEDYMFGSAPNKVCDAFYGNNNSTPSNVESFGFGEKSKEFMNKMGYEMKPYIAYVHTYESRTAYPEPNFKTIYLDEKIENIEKVTNWCYAPKNCSETYKIITNYNPTRVYPDIKTNKHIRETWEVRQYNYNNKTFSKSNLSFMEKLMLNFVEFIPFLIK